MNNYCVPYYIKFEHQCNWKLLDSNECLYANDRTKSRNSVETIWQNISIISPSRPRRGPFPRAFRWCRRYTPTRTCVRSVSSPSVYARWRRTGQRRRNVRNRTEAQCHTRESGVESTYIRPRKPCHSSPSDTGSYVGPYTSDWGSWRTAWKCRLWKVHFVHPWPF